MAKAVGIGGIFLHFKGELQDVMEWYETHLGFDMTDYGTGFTSGEQLLLVSFKREPESEAPYLNIRVDDIEELIQDLKKQDITIINEIKEYPYGKFAQIKDPFGNALELWQVYEEPYKKMVQDEVESYKNKKVKQ